MEKIIRVYKQDGSATTDPAEILALIKSGEDLELDYDSGKGVKASSTSSLKGKTVLVGKEKVEVA